jgi:hypothetical protein
MPHRFPKDLVGGMEWSMKERTMTIETIRERFRAIGLGASLPGPGEDWCRLGDHIHWLDLVGLGNEGLCLHANETPVAYELLSLAGAGVFPRTAGCWFPLAFPVAGLDPLQQIVEGISPRGRQGECAEVVFEVLSRVARRNPDLVAALLPRARTDLRFRIEQMFREDSRHLEECPSLCSFIVEAGDRSDLELLSQNMGTFSETGLLRFVCDVHARGWQRETCFLEALENVKAPEIHRLHEGLLHLREGGDLSELDSWLSHEGWTERILVLIGLHRMIPQVRVGEEILEMLLPRLWHEDNDDCAVALGWVLGLVLERMDAAAALEVVKALEILPQRDCCGFHAGMRALVRTRLSASEREHLLHATEPLVETESRDVAYSVGVVRLHLSGARTVPWDLSGRLSEQRGWLQDLAEPGRTWEGLLGDLIADRIDPQVALWLCLDPKSAAPLWLRSHLLGRTALRHPSCVRMMEQASRPNDTGESRVVAAHALLLYPGPVEPEALYLACATDEFPTTMPEDSLRVAIHLIHWLNDPILEMRARKLLAAGGPICREVARHWYSSVITNDFDMEHVEMACARLAKLGATEPPRPLGATDIHSFVRWNGLWSEEGDDIFLLGDLSTVEPMLLATRLELVTDRNLLGLASRRLAKHWKDNPEVVLTAWDALNERKDWQGREAALTMIKDLDSSFVQGKAGERRRTRLKELLTDEDSDVVRAAKTACANLGV